MKCSKSFRFPYFYATGETFLRKLAIFRKDAEVIPAVYVFGKVFVEYASHVPRARREAKNQKLNLVDIKLKNERDDNHL